MTNLAVVSIFRDNDVYYIGRYYEQVSSLIGFSLRFYMVEGDSQDDTYQHIVQAGQIDHRVMPIKHDTGIKRYGSVVHPERFKCLSQTANAGLDRVAADGWADYVMWIESDLIFDTNLAYRLIETARKGAIVAPVVMAGGSFYDIWGFRYAADREFTPHMSDFKGKVQPFPVWSAGSCLFFPAELLDKGVRMTEDQSIVGFCRKAYEQGVITFCDPRLVIFHPVGGGPLNYQSNLYLFHPSKWLET